MKPNPRLIHITALLAAASPLVIGLLLPATAHAQAGIPLWTNRYNGPGNVEDQAYALAVDANSNVYVTGYSFEGPSYTNSDYVTIKYSSAGMSLWTNRYAGPANSYDEAHALAVDASGNVVVTGSSYGSGSSRDFATIRYSSAGQPLWTNRYNGPANSFDTAQAIAVDASGNVVVTGYSMGNGGNYDYATIKYSAAGVPVWTNRYNGPLGGSDYPAGVAVDGSGNVVVTGRNQNSNATDLDYATIKYSSAGAPLWTNRFSTGWDYATAVAVDSSGNIYVTGESANDYATIKYSSAGLPLWTNRYNGPENMEDTARAMALDGNGNVYVTGGTGGAGAGGGKGFATVAYSSAGVPVWTNRYSAPGTTNGAGNAIAVDARGNVYVTGYSQGSGNDDDYSTLAYSNAGVPLWTNRYNAQGTYNDYPRGIALDGAGNVYVTGYSISSGSGSDFATIKYAGVPQTLPFILSQPISRTNSVGVTSSFSVTAGGDAPLGYQWRKSGTNLLNGGRVSGAATTNLGIANVQLGDAGDYTVVVTNIAGSVTSSVARLTVYSPGRFSNVSYSPAMGFTFVFRDGTVGRSYRIQTSSSLTEGSWFDWMSFNYTSPVGFIDLGAAEAERRFYRAVSP